jgi:toxin ParE1/3/4
VRLAFRPAAEDDLLEVALWIARDSPERAMRFVAALRERATQILAFPSAAPLRPELGEGVRAVVFRGYILAYRLEDDQVIILRIVHGARDLVALFREPS